jgi:uncharacterized protein YfaS (alpha-2-macroglobulin family)
MHIREGIIALRSKFQQIDKKRFFPLLGFCLLLAVVAIAESISSKRIRDNARTTEEFGVSNVLYVTRATLDDATNPQAVELKFNHPVDVHALEHAAIIVPKMAGYWQASEADPKIVTYTFEKVFKGKDVSVYIPQGLTSLNNKTLLNDYEKHLATARQTQLYGRVNTFPAGKSILLNGDVATTSIYQSNAQELLQFLTYELPEGEGRGSIYDGTFKISQLATANRNKLQNVKQNIEENTVELDPGVYYVVEEFQEPYFIVVSSFGVVLRQDDQQVMLHAFNLQDGSSLNGLVTFGLYNLKDSVNLIRDFVYTPTNTTVPLSYPTRLDTVIGIHNEEVVFIPVEVPSSQADILVSSNLDSDRRVFLYTDRPIYKPGDTVFFRGIVRQDSDAQYKAPVAGSTINVKLENYNDKEDVLLPATINEHGVFAGHMVLPQTYKTGYASIQAAFPHPSNPDRVDASASFEILNYTKPEFEIKTTVVKPEYLRSEKMQFRLTGNYFNGQPLANKEVSYSLFTDNYFEVEKAVYNSNFNITGQGGMCGGGGFDEYLGEAYKKGTVTLNAAGEAVVEVTPNDSTPLSQKVTLLAKVIDGNKNEIVTASNTIVHAATFTIFFIPSADRYMAGEEIVAPFYVESLNGEKIRNTAFTYKLLKGVEVYDETFGGNTLISGTVTTDENGKGLVRAVMPSEQVDNGFQLLITAKDAQGNTSENRKTLSLISEEEKKMSQVPRFGGRLSQTYLKITSNQNSFKVGDTVSLTIDSPRELDVLMTLERGRIYQPRVLHLAKGMNTVEFAINEELSPSITVVFSFFADGQYRTEGLSLNTPAMHKLLNITLQSDKKQYTPQETALMTVTTTDANGVPVAASMSLGVVDKAIYALRESATPPIHSSFYYFRPRRTNASSSLTPLGDWGGRGGGGGGGAGGPGSTADILYWNPDVRTDATGQITLPIPLLGHQTIWKAQAIGSTVKSQFGQADLEFTVTAP